MKYVVFMVMMLMASIASAEPVRVAVIDTGYNGYGENLCPNGHHDFIKGTDTIGVDLIGHGTKVVDAIRTYAEDAPYCIMVFRVFGKPGIKGVNGTPDTPIEYTGGIPAAINMAVKRGAKVLNLSLDGESPYDEERLAIASAVIDKVVVFAAAGNKGLNLDKECKSYPACYKLPGVIVVGSQDAYGKVVYNHGKIIDEYEPERFGSMYGTSASTAIATGKFVKGYK